MWSNDHNYNTCWFQIELFRITVSESHKMCVYICASNINIKNRTYSRSRSPQSTWTDEKSQAAMKRWFSSSRCEVAHALEETEDEKKSIHNTTLRIQHKHLNLRPSPQVCCDPEMTIFWYCSLISIERIRPTQNWLCVHKLEITIDFFFPPLFKKQEHFGTGRYVFLVSWGGGTQKHSGKWGMWWFAWSPTSCLSRNWKKGMNAKEWIRPALGPAIFRDQPLYGEPFFSPGFWCWSLTTPDGTVQCHGFSYLWREEPVVMLPGRRADHRSCDIIWGQMWRISDSHSFHWSLPLQFSLVPSWDLGGLQLINGSQIALLTWQTKHLHWRERLDN